MKRPPGKLYEIDEKHCLSLERVGRHDRLRLWRTDGWRKVSGVKLAVTRSGCGIEELSVSPSGRWIVTQRSSDQEEWGYDVLATVNSDPDDGRGIRRGGGVRERHGYMLELPVFSEDERRIVGGYGEQWLGGWHAHREDEIEEPARGGRVSFGWIFDHRLPEHVVSWHELLMDIPVGYLPDIEDEAWYGAFDIEPLGQGVAFTLPGGEPFEHPDPLPETLLLPTPQLV